MKSLLHEANLCSSLKFEETKKGVQKVLMNSNFDSKFLKSLNFKQFPKSEFT